MNCILLRIVFCIGLCFVSFAEANTVNVRDFQAAGDGVTLDTVALQTAIDACRETGGGTVLFPAGTYLSGALFTYSNITLQFEKGATLLGSGDLSHYPMMDTRWEGTEGKASASLINAINARNVVLTGEGTIAGSGAGESKSPAGPRVAEFIRCQNIVIENLTFTNKGRWTIHPVYCDNVFVRNLTIQTAGHNADGIDPDSSRNVFIRDCRIDTSDDCIAIKSGKNQQAIDIGKPSENIIVEDCVMTGGHGGVVVGSEMSGGVRNVLARNCRFETLWKGIRLKTRLGRGGVVENIRYENIAIDQVAVPIELDMQYNSNAGGLIKGPEGIPVFRNIEIRNVTITGAANPGEIRGLPESPVQGLILENIHAETTDTLKISHVSGLTMIHLTNSNHKEAVVLENVRVKPEQ